MCSSRLLSPSDVAAFVAVAVAVVVAAGATHDDLPSEGMLIRTANCRGRRCLRVQDITSEERQCRAPQPASMPATICDRDDG